MVLAITKLWRNQQEPNREGIMIMKNFLCGLVLIGLTVCLLGVTAFAVTPTKFHGSVTVTKDLVVQQDLTVTNPIIVGSDSLLKTVTFFVDSLGYDAETAVGIFTPHRGVTVLKVEGFSIDSVGAAGDTTYIIVRSGTVLSHIAIPWDYGLYSIEYTTPFSIPAGVPCTTFIDDGNTAATHTKSATIRFQFTDD